jgi:GTP cyclohydrolase IA
MSTNDEEARERVLSVNFEPTHLVLSSKYEQADDAASDPEMLTVVTASPAPSEVMDGEATTTMTEKKVVCLRLSGQVCICDSCEAARLRMFHRHSNSSNNKKRVRADQVTTTTTTLATVTRKKPAIECCDEEDSKVRVMASACKTILECIGEDPYREGLVKTPERWAKALLFMCSGYSKTPEEVTNGAVFAENHNEMVVVRNIDIHSLCEHHMVPFTGRVHIGYIPNGKILGLSKLARIAELYARRLQVQERLTRQIADAIVETVTPLGVAVVVECTHLCMVLRGVQKTGAMTTTSSVRGCFESNPKTRAEFFSIIHGRCHNG